MANEITCTKTIAVNKGGFAVNQAHSSLESMSGFEMLKDTQVVGLAWELVLLGEITLTPAEIQIVNLDSTNFVQLTTVTTDANAIFAKIRPGKSAQWPPNASALYAKADTAAVRIGKTAADAPA